ncbi:hypothetical protein EVAR_3584_1 [Eumeta japonica]|uniref:Uncharacterized protein n=1 Tax=Eumeta variegata TaxID=151549 RepID=A0A4C1SWB6_EUMVA|nr:hypothetical protein EVAR_3584_1 [Eumeta japonica]
MYYIYSAVVVVLVQCRAVQLACSFVGHPRPFLGRRCGTEDLLLPHARASSRRLYDPDGPMVMAPFRGSKSWNFPSPPEIQRSCQWIHRHLPRPSRPALGMMVKWWVAASSGPEKVDDGEPRRTGKTTTITHLTAALLYYFLTSIPGRTITGAAIWQPWMTIVSGRRANRYEGRRCLCHVVNPLKDYRDYATYVHDAFRK